MAGLSWIDWLVVALYMAFVVLVGAIFARREKSGGDFFLAGRSVPMWAAAVSVLATSLSAVTFLGGPQEAYDNNLTYLSLNLGGLLAVVLVAIFFIPAYYRAQVTSVYELVGSRLGPNAERATSAMFLLGRIFASGARLYIASIPLSLIVFGDLAPAHLMGAIAIVALVATLYTVSGGIGAVIWTDAAQMLVLLTAAGACIWLLLDRIPLPAGEIVEALRASTTDTGASKLTLFDTRLDPSLPFTIWGALVGMTLFNMAAYGTDQDLVQRMLTCRSAVRGSWSLVLSNILGMAVVAVFLALGLLLYIFYARPDLMGDSAPAPVEDSRRVFLRFILTETPIGLRGLMIAGLLAAAMSSLDSALNAMSSAAVCNFVRPRLGRITPKQEVRLARVFVGVFAVLLAGFACACVWLQRESDEGLLPFALGVMLYAYAGTLAVFCCALFTRRGNATTALAALATGFLAVGAMQFGPKWIDAWPLPAFALGWRMAIGFALAFAVCLLGRRTGMEREGREETR
ncbi:MAG: sodium:solute symporter, partial [Phycisphaerales bacterium]